MKKQLLFIAAVAVLLFLLSHLGDNTSSFHFFFTLILIPAFCVFVGGFAGWNFSKRWFFPFVLVAADLLLALFFGTISESQTVLYAGFVLLLGVVTMLLMAIARSFASSR